jgi:hypothetical protein
MTARKSKCVSIENENKRIYNERWKAESALMKQLKHKKFLKHQAGRIYEAPSKTEFAAATINVTG